MKKSKKGGAESTLGQEAQVQRTGQPKKQQSTTKQIWCDAALQLWVHLGFGPVGSTDQKVNPHPTRMNQQ
jgi:hypothetical protein